MRDRANSLFWTARRVFAETFLEPRGFRDTAEGVSLGELGLEHDEWNPYAPSGWRWIRRALKACDAGHDDVFVDIGSGKGRVLYQAARLPLRRVIGVEVSEELNEVARANLAAAAGRLRCKDVEIVTADAASWAVPDDLTIAYLYNPFSGEVFKQVLDNLAASLRRRPRRMYLIYANPQMEHLVLESGVFSLLTRTRGGHRPPGERRGSLSIYVGDGA